MRIEHIAIWVNDIEKMKAFYIKYFDAVSNEKYANAAKKFESYFLSFDGSARIELMHRPDITQNPKQHNSTFGIAHFAITVENKEHVNMLTEQLRADGYTIAGEPRTTGDGYYESVILDPEGNFIELTGE